MPADLVTRIAGESEENRAQREQLTKQLDVLMKGSDTCKHFIGVRNLGKKAPNVFLSQRLLICWIDADNGTIQPSLRFKSTKNNSDNFDVTSDNSSQKGVESEWETPLPDFSPVSIPDFSPASIPDFSPVSKAAIVKNPDKEPVHDSKKKSKRPKISSKQAIFEQD